MISSPQVINAVKAAFLACAPRIVPASFRIAETYHPELKRSKVVMAPGVVTKRELITLGLTGLFSFITNLLINSVATHKDKKKETLILFLSAVIGSGIAELVARKFAYRSMLEQARKPPAEEKSVPVYNDPQKYLWAIRQEVSPPHKEWVS